MTNNSGLKREELEFWLKHTADTLAGKEIEYTEQQKEQLKYLSHRKPNMNDITSTAHLVADSLRQEQVQDIQVLQSTIGILMNIIQDKLDVTDEEFQSYAKDFENEVKELEKEKIQELKKQQEKAYKEKQESKSNEKVVEFNKGDE